MTDCVALFKRFIEETPGYHEFDYEYALMDFKKWLEKEGPDLSSWYNAKPKLQFMGKEGE